jgi:3-hydroxyacyl-[acyl-carrier-protein] dehydratase
MTNAVLTQPTPLTERLQILSVETVDNGFNVLANTIVDPDNPILAGHYPGAPIFPGVCLIECAHRAVLLAALANGLTAVLQAVPSARFLDAVRPRDALSIQAGITRDDPHWNVTAKLHSQRALAAKVNLLYRVREGTACTD